MESLQNYGSPHSSIYQTLSAFWLAVRATRTHKFPFHNHKEADTSVDKTPASKWPIHQLGKATKKISRLLDLSPHFAKQRANYLDKMHIYDSISHPSTKLCWLFDLQNGCEKVPRSDNQPAKGNRTKIRWLLKRNQSDQRNPEFHVSTDYFVTFAVSLV